MSALNEPPAASPDDNQGPQAPPRNLARRRRILWWICGLVLTPPLVIGLIVFRIYGMETHHADLSGVWLSERGRSLIPPTATDISLRRDLLDHYAVYTITEKELNTFLDRRFGRPGTKLDSYSERSPVDPVMVGKPIGPLDWVVTRNTVLYVQYASNGGAHTYYHDTKTGRTYQSSAYW